MTVWLSSPGGGGTIPGFCWRGRKGSDMLVISTTVWNHKITLESHNWGDRVACRHLLGLVTCSIRCPSQKAQPHPEQIELTFFPRRPWKKLKPRVLRWPRVLSLCVHCRGLCNLHPLQTVCSTPAVDCAVYTRCGMYSLHSTGPLSTAADTAPGLLRKPSSSN